MSWPSAVWYSMGPSGRGGDNDTGWSDGDSADRVVSPKRHLLLCCRGCGDGGGGNEEKNDRFEPVQICEPAMDRHDCLHGRDTVWSNS